MKKILSLALLVSCTSPTVFAGGECLSYGPATVSLEGRVSLRKFYGPPGYGESPKTDARETQAVLILDKPVCTLAGQEDYAEAETGQKQITLGGAAGIKLAAFSGKRVVARGTLFHAHTGHHHTPVLLSVQTIEKREK
ncbi:hypothetical protein BH11PSE11_BH11PSE11_19770 [soil metagenome]